MSLGCLGYAVTPKPLGRYKPSDLQDKHVTDFMRKAGHTGGKWAETDRGIRARSSQVMCPQRHHVYMRLTLAAGKDMAHLKVHVCPRGEMREPLGQQDSAEGGSRGWESSDKAGQTHANP